MSISQPPQIGKNIMSLRKQKGMSLDDLAKRSGVSKSMLSQIEQDKTNPTVITAWKIALALDSSVQELIESGSGSIVEVIRCDDAPVIYSDNKSCKIKINSPVHMTDSLELYQIYLKPGSRNNSMPHFPQAEEFLTVIQGKIQVTSADSTTLLSKGDTARYKADVAHCIENVGTEDAEGYLIVWLPK